ncbi:MAG TPA: hypothetical protein VJ802_05020 [Gemmatimonadaceae bacterium]|nr:hypothetical protein [Gemmatimonadaceae bacterium]
MRPLSLDRLRLDGQRFMEEVSREYFLAHAGLKATADLQTIYERHAGILGEDALALVREEFRGAAPGSDAHRSARLMLEWLTDSVASRALAALDEREIAWEGSAVVRLDDGRELPYQRAAIDIGNTANRDERMMIERARARVVESELAPLRRERFQREKELIEGMEIAPTFNATFEALSGVNLTGLVGECDDFLRDTQSMWDDVYAETVRSKLRMDPADATRADALHLLRAQEFDAHFPSASMEASIRRQTAEMGIDPDAGGRIIFDTGEREGKRARAFCAPVRVPDEVYLVLRPHGGQADYRTLLHELGHALHFAYTRPDYPFEWRWLGDNSVTEGYAMLLDHLMHDAGWLARYTELGRRHAPTFLRTVGFEELHFLRRYCAKLIYEVTLYGGEVGWDSLPDLYVDRLTSATTFRYDRADAFVDVDPRFYAARYLRAWQLQALLTETLVERFNEDWWRNPHAGPWVIGTLFGEGQRELAGELGERATGRALSFAPLVRAIEDLLVTS